MTAALNLEALQREQSADLATLREIEDLVSAIRPGPLAEDVAGIAWWFHTEPPETEPTLNFGLGHETGFLRWYEAGKEFVPEGIRYQGGDVFYASGTGLDYGVDPGEEILVEYVYAAALEFVATGERPKVIRWVTPPLEPPKKEPSATKQEIWNIMAEINAEAQQQ